MHRTAPILSAVALLMITSQSSIAAEAHGGSIVQPASLAWMPADGLPPGAQIAVVYGNPSKEGLFAVRLKFPAGYEIPTHSHPTDEFITILSGNGRMAFGEKADAAGAEPMPAGAFIVLPAGGWHHLWIDAETVVELHSMGPFVVNLMKH